MDGNWFWAVVVLAAISGFIGIQLAKMRGRATEEGFALGFFLGPIGWIIEAMQTDLKRAHTQTAIDGRPLWKCLYCAEMILIEAKVCKHCGRDVPPENATGRLGEKARGEAKEQATQAVRTAEDNSFTNALVLVVVVCIFVVLMLVMSGA